MKHGRVMKPNSILFVIPDSNEFPSGGNIYNAHIMDELIQMGIIVLQKSLLDVDEKLLNNHEVVIVDSLYLQDFKHASAHTLLLVHHLESLSPKSANHLFPALISAEKLMLEKFNTFICTSPYTADYLQHYGFNKTIVVEPGFNLRIQKMPKEKAPIQVLMINNFQKRKRIFEFLQVINQYEIKSDFRINIIGDATSDPAYFKKCASLIEHSPTLSKYIQILGSKSHNEVAKYLSIADLFISTSEMETYGMALQEARYFAIPILLTKGGYAEKHVQWGNGIALDTVHQLVDKMLYICYDIKALQMLKMKAVELQKRISHYSWEKAAQRFRTEINLHFNAKNKNQSNHPFYN